MWRNENEIALNEIIVAAQEITDHYHYAAEALGENRLRTVFDDLAGQRQTLIEELMTRIERTGRLPDVPDNDKETLEQLFSQLKTLFATDERSVFMEERQQAEAELEILLETALTLSWEADVKQLLLRLQQLATSAQRRLAAAGQILEQPD
jgi:uncharacterized protein (TIGR02284 family)